VIKAAYNNINLKEYLQPLDVVCEVLMVIFSNSQDIFTLLFF